jgi:hypothetical protein
MQKPDACNQGTTAAGRGSRAMTRITVLQQNNANAAVPHAKRLWASAGAAGLAEALTMPVDFAKVRLQLQNNTAVTGVRYKGMAHCISCTLRTEGPGALFKGLGPALARQMGYTGLSFLLYEPIRNGISPSGALFDHSWPSLARQGHNLTLFVRSIFANRARHELCQQTTRRGGSWRGGDFRSEPDGGDQDTNSGKPCQDIGC